MTADNLASREEPPRSDPRTLELVRSIAAELETGGSERVEHLLDELTRIRESSLFRELGHITRQLHDSLASIRDDTQVTEIASKNLPDARARLDFVLSKTEEAAHRTLGAVEAALPIAAGIGESADSMRGEWHRFRSRQMTAEEFRVLARDVDGFLGVLSANAAQLGARLSDVLMAQDYQDLTGQIIRRVIELVEEIDGELVRVLRDRGTPAVPHPATRVAGERRRGEGPQIDASRPDVVSTQDDVDDLLSSLGF